MKIHEIGKLFAVTTLLLMSLVYAGCGESSADPDEDMSDGAVDEDDIEPVEGLCVRNPEMLAQQQRCFSDDICPCGSHCERGLCVYDCEDNADCDDDTICDDFGRCNASGNIVSPMTVSPQALLTVEPSSLVMFDVGDECVVWVTAVGHSTKGVRVFASDGLEVMCATGEYATECNFDGIAAGIEGAQLLHVRLVTLPEEDAANYRDVQIIADGVHKSLGVVVPKTDPPAMKRAVSSISGVYQGFAWPESAGFMSRSARPLLPDMVSAIRVPITAEIYSDSGGNRVIALSDELHVLFPDERLMGTLVEDEDSWNLNLASRHFLGPETPDNEDVEVIVTYKTEELIFDDGLLDVALFTVFDGVTLDEYSPYLRFRLVLRRTGDLDEGVIPPVTDAYTPLLDPSRTTIELGNETATLDVLPLDLGFSPQDKAEAVMCTDTGEEAAVRRLKGELLEIEGVVSPVGDLACLGEATGTIEPQRTFGILATNLLDVNEFVQTCLNDLKNLDGVSGPGSDGCVDAPRALTVAALAFETDRGRALGVLADAEPGASAVGHRLVQQWLGLQGFLARESLQIRVLRDIAPEVEQNFTIFEAMEAAINGWDWLLHPRIAVPLPNLLPSVLCEPDYRVHIYPSLEIPLSFTHEQPVGLPVVILHVLRTQTKTLVRLMLDVREGTADIKDVEPLVRALLRRSFIVLGLAHGLHDNARTLCEPDWEDSWQIALIEAGVGIRNLLNAVKDYHLDVNVLGIEDDDLPIYRIGDEVAASKRFAALTDFLLGENRGASTTSVAPHMMTRAEEALDAARSAWVQNIQRDFTGQLTEQARSRRIEGVHRRYGERIASLCGNPDLDAATVLETWDTIDADTCYIDDDCLLSDEEILRRVTVGTVGYQLCLTQRLRESFGSLASSGDEDVDRAIDGIGPSLGINGDPFDIEITAAVPGAITVLDRSEGKSWTFDHEMLRTMVVDLPPDSNSELLLRLRDECNASRQATAQQRPTMLPDSCERIDDCPRDYICDSTSCTIDTMLTFGDNPECYWGTLGELALAVTAAAEEVEIARSVLSEYTESYDIAMKTCIIAQTHKDSMEEALENHNNQMHTLASVKLGAQITANVAAAAKDVCNIGKNIISGGGVAAGAIVEAAANSVVDGMDYAMEEAQRQHEENMMALQNEMENAMCLNDATMHLVGVSTQQRRIKQAIIELNRQLIEYRNHKTDLNALVSEGHAALENEQSRRVAPINTDFWLDEHVERFRDSMRQAKRALYLAVIVAEYEFQFSSIERQNTLAARTPQDIQNIIDDLRAYVLTGTVAGASPGNLFTVISLRDHLLQLADLSSFPDGWQQLSPDERFRVWITSPRFALYDTDGNYLGQQIPFQLYPLGTTGLGEAHGIPLLAGTDCAERLWSVNASLMGDAIYSGSDTTFTRVVLRKRNTFFSQWCSSHEEIFQTASTRPSRNLFIDPYGRTESQTVVTPEPDKLTTDEVNAYTQARISAYFNVSRTELEDEAYFNGDSQELAGRGLYGDYALFFSAETLSVNGSQGLRIDHIQDVLLRFDYVSVAR